MNYFDFDVSNSATKVVYLEDANLYLRPRTISHTMYVAKFEQTIPHQHILLRRESQSHVLLGRESQSY